MEQVKKTDTHRIYKKRSGRHAVEDLKSKQWINGDDKAAILLAEGLIKQDEPTAPAPEAEAEAGDAAETPAEWPNCASRAQPESAGAAGAGARNTSNAFSSSTFRLTSSGRKLAQRRWKSRNSPMRCQPVSA
jgi:hypothetical protein